MSAPQFCIKSDTFKKNICNGLSSFQQQEEFVDMTLAADGHFVKVHQIIVSLASPYLKELILSAPCPHPVVFLNKISYPILCCILEYIYMGEVMVNKESLLELIEAGKELHINGLQDMQFSQDMAADKVIEKTNPLKLVESMQQLKSQSNEGKTCNTNLKTLSNDEDLDDLYEPFTDVEEDHLREDDINMSGSQRTTTKTTNTELNQNTVSLNLVQSQNNSASTSDLKTVQYTLSNQSNLQLILNRFVYNLRYCHKNSDPPVRMWRCVDYCRGKCPASVTTKDDIVIQRVSAHKHGFHDNKILKKLKNGTIFTAIKDAENKGLQDKKKS